MPTVPCEPTSINVRMIGSPDYAIPSRSCRSRSELLCHVSTSEAVWAAQSLRPIQRGIAARYIRSKALLEHASHSGAVEARAMLAGADGFLFAPNRSASIMARHRRKLAAATVPLERSTRTLMSLPGPSNRVRIVASSGGWLWRHSLTFGSVCVPYAFGTGLLPTGASRASLVAPYTGWHPRSSC
jgi:hypothetical protein